ncbi:uncharacterized protein LOC111100411 isoform X2 [Crassostrea virginica]
MGFSFNLTHVILYTILLIVIALVSIATVWNARTMGQLREETNHKRIIKCKRERKRSQLDDDDVDDDEDDDDDDDDGCCRNYTNQRKTLTAKKPPRPKDYCIYDITEINSHQIHHMFKNENNRSRKALSAFNNAVYKSTDVMKMSRKKHEGQNSKMEVSLQAHNECEGRNSTRLYGYLDQEDCEEMETEYLLYSDYDDEFESYFDNPSLEPSVSSTTYKKPDDNLVGRREGENKNCRYAGTFEGGVPISKLQPESELLLLDFKYKYRCIQRSMIDKYPCARLKKKSFCTFKRMPPGFQEYLGREIQKLCGEKMGNIKLPWSKNFRKSNLFLSALNGLFFQRPIPEQIYVVLPATSIERKQIARDSSESRVESYVQGARTDDDLDVACLQVNTPEQEPPIEDQIPIEHSPGEIETTELAPHIRNLGVESRNSNVPANFRAGVVHCSSLSSTETLSSFFTCSSVSLSSVEEDESFSYEWIRLKTFTEWPLMSIFSTTLARNGWVALGQGDKARCYSCHVVHEGWKVGDSPEKYHRPNCRRGFTNLPISREPSIEGMPQGLEMQRRECTAFVNDSHDVPEGESRNRYTSAQNMSQENSYIYLQVDPPSMIGNNLGYFEQLPSRNPMNDSIGPCPSPICLSRSVEVIPDSTNTESSDVDYNGRDNTALSDSDIDDTIGSFLEWRE